VRGRACGIVVAPEPDAPPSRHPGSWPAARATAALQENVISLGQLNACGLTKHTVGRAVRAGHLAMEGGGVYRMSAAPPSPRGLCWAALLRAGPDAVLSHRTAAVLWALVQDWGPRLHVTSRRHRRHGHATVLHQATLTAHDTTRRNGLRVTSLARTLLDLAATEPEAVLLVAVRQALTLHGTRKRSVFAGLDRAGGHPGRGPLKRALDALAADPGRGEGRGPLEDAFWLTVLPYRDRLPAYERNVSIRLGTDDVYTGDIVFAGPRVVVELDSREFHDNDSSFDSDRRRDRRLAANGWLVIRITHRHLRDDAAGVIEDLLAVLAARS
jgi:very-short-patch-repair endonuclease